MRKLLLVPAILFSFALVLDAPADEMDPAKLIQKSIDLLRAKKYDEAREAIDKVIEKEPKNDRARMIASEIGRLSGHYADGLRHAQAALRINDKVTLYYALIAANAYYDEEPELALEYCRKVLDMGPSKAGESVYKDVKAYEDMLVKKTITITWKLDLTDERHHKFIRDYIPLAVPKDGLPYQSVTVQVKDAKSHRFIKGEANDMLQVVPNGKKMFQVVNKVTLTPVSYKSKLAKAAQSKGNGSLPPSVQPYLGTADSIDPKSEELKKIAAEVKGSNSVETVRNILKWLKKHIVYKAESSDINKLDFTKVEEIIERGHAECRGYTMLFAALCRASGIPARPVWGLLFVERGFKSHNWDEVYISGVGWVPVDPQAAETFGWLPINRVRMFMDLRKTATTEENLPLLNLLFMNGEKLQFEQSR